jgi:hypothetical protein
MTTRHLFSSKTEPHHRVELTRNVLTVAVKWFLISLIVYRHYYLATSLARYQRLPSFLDIVAVKGGVMSVRVPTVRV